MKITHEQFEQKFTEIFNESSWEYILSIPNIAIYLIEAFQYSSKEPVFRCKNKDIDIFSKRFISFLKEHEIGIKEIQDRCPDVISVLMEEWNNEIIERIESDCQDKNAFIKQATKEIKTGKRNTSKISKNYLFGGNSTFK